MRHGVGIHPVSLEDPIVATYLIQVYCNTSRGGMLEEKKFVRKNLQSQVAVVGPLFGWVVALRVATDQPQCFLDEHLTLGLPVAHPLGYAFLVVLLGKCVQGCVSPLVLHVVVVQYVIATRAVAL